MRWPAPPPPGSRRERAERVLVAGAMLAGGGLLYAEYRGWLGFGWLFALAWAAGGLVLLLRAVWPNRAEAG